MPPMGGAGLGGAAGVGAGGAAGMTDQEQAMVKMVCGHRIVCWISD